MDFLLVSGRFCALGVFGGILGGLVDFLSVSGGFCGSGRFSVEFWDVWWISGGFLVGFWWVLWFWAVLGGILDSLVDFLSVSGGFFGSGRFSVEF